MHVLSSDLLIGTRRTLKNVVLSYPGARGEWKSAGGAAAVPAAGDGTSQPVCPGAHACLLQCYHAHTAE